MQTEAPEVLDILTNRRKPSTFTASASSHQRLWPALPHGRKLVEKGVRFVCVVSGGGSGRLTWDAHDDIEETICAWLRKRTSRWRPCSRTSSAAACSIPRWCFGWEFGRSPEAESGKGRDHHNLGFSMWLAGGGIKGGQVVGATDAIGLMAVDKPYHLRDVHNTILNQLGSTRKAHLSAPRSQRTPDLHRRQAHHGDI